MNVCYLYIQSIEHLDDFADRLRKIINISTTNPTPELIDQKRYGLNYGGEYYAFECFGLEIMLVRNEGEVGDSDYEDYQFYLEVQSKKDFDEKLFHDGILKYLQMTLEDSGLKTQLED
ncbi:hypothetical protein [Cyclobacterium amurskyense]|uniref:Uncharacterized protein n=1 Tax=Cyclobacterium amurskyense TaxID=320787 RepID=A0A0H4PL51_9BACT|nr:hypothetical protein [Cyclobacterium amurskyense]AKP53753.1 hypothetical protein CA2015_4411 [Cyclobacterium amurskyense]